MPTKGVELAQKGDHPRTVPVESHPLPHCGVTEVQLHVNLAIRYACILSPASIRIPGRSGEIFTVVPRRSKSSRDSSIL